MRALEDHDGTYLASWKRLFRVDKARTVQRWRDNIEPELIRLWTQRAAVEDIEDDDSDAPPG
ncbi:MAG: hypothetical protein KF777_00175 [Planctomycetaceae bacterium]|nr:hypothetical protein [Planctomycetaceae bacterium]